MDSSKKCHNSVCFKPIFDFKNTIESKLCDGFGKFINFGVVFNFLYTISYKSLKYVQNIAPALITHRC